MKDLLVPKTYRLKKYQEVWLKRKAVEEGHDQMSIVLRRAIDDAIHFHRVTGPNRHK